jgi:hypothetical protein
MREEETLIDLLRLKQGVDGFNVVDHAIAPVLDLLFDIHRVPLIPFYGEARLTV